MGEVKAVINDVKTGKSYSRVVDGSRLSGKKIGEAVKGSTVDLGADYEFVITGGSDDAGFPMRKSLEGIGRKKILMKKGVGLKIIKGHPKGYLKRKSVRGNTIGVKTAQVNLKVSKYGKKSLEEIFGKKEEKVEEVVEKKHKETPKPEKKEEVHKEKPKEEKHT